MWDREACKREEEGKEMGCLLRLYNRVPEAQGEDGNMKARQPRVQQAKGEAVTGVRAGAIEVVVEVRVVVAVEVAKKTLPELVVHSGVAVGARAGAEEAKRQHPARST